MFENAVSRPKNPKSKFGVDGNIEPAVKIENSTHVGVPIDALMFFGSRNNNNTRIYTFSQID